MTIDPLSVSLISLDQAVAHLAAADREVDGDVALAHYRKHERAIARLYEALCSDALIALVRDPSSSALIRLIGHNWQGAAFWRDIVVGGNVRSPPGEDVALYDGWSVVLERSEFEGWAGAPPKAPADRTAKNAPLSKQLDEAIREEIRRARKEAKTAGDKPPNRNQICQIVQPRMRARGLMVAHDQIKQIDREPEFANRQKTGVRFSK